MKQREKYSGRGCESRQVHQKYSKLDAGSKKVESGLIATSMLEIKNTLRNHSLCSLEYFYQTYP